MRPSPRGLAALALVPLLGPPSLALLLAACGADRPLAPAPSADAVSAASANSGSITIVLDMQPNRPVDVPFLTEGRKLKDFKLDDDVNSGIPNSQTFPHLRPGSYTVQQAAVAGVTLVDLTCESSGAGNITIDEGNRSVTVQLESGESVTCAFVGYMPLWENGDLITYSQVPWGDATNAAGQLLSAKFFDVYTSGLVEIGLSGTAGFSVRFIAPSFIISYLPASGSPAALDADLADPGTTSSGQFGGEVLALTLNIDLSDAGFLVGSSGVGFGDLTLCSFTPLSTLNGLTVRDFLGLANTLLSGGTNGYGITDLNAITESLNGSFEAGTASQFAQEHLVSGVCP